MLLFPILSGIICFWRNYGHERHCSFLWHSHFVYPGFWLPDMILAALKDNYGWNTMLVFFVFLCGVRVFEPDNHIRTHIVDRGFVAPKHSVKESFALSGFEKPLFTMFIHGTGMSWLYTTENFLPQRIPIKISSAFYIPSDVRSN